MKRILFLLTICLGGLLNAQTSYTLASVDKQPEVIDQVSYDFVQKIISQKQIHIHPDSVNHGFTICWNGPDTTYTIIGMNKRKIKTGKIKNTLHIKTKRWKDGTYVLKIGEHSDILVLMKDKN